jgi:hypothetical protein
MIKLIFGGLVLFLTFTHPTQAEFKTISDLQFPRDAKLSGWSYDPATVKVTGNRLEIKSLSGKGNEWQSNVITYQPGFSIENADVRIEIDVTSQNLYRDFFLAFFPVGSHPYQEPAVMINIDHPGEGTSRILVRQFENGSQKSIVLKDPKLPFIFDNNIKVTLVLANGQVKLSVDRDRQHKTFDLGRIISPRWVLQPFTIQIGTSQHGNSNDPAVVNLSRVQILTTRTDENTAAESVGNGPGKDDTVTYIDLTPYANRRFEDETGEDKIGGWTDQGANDMRFIPKGYQFFRNVPFYISDKLAVIGNAPEPGCIVLGGKNSPGLMMETKPMPVNAPAGYLYFLQASAWSDNNIHCADYIVKYADGSTAAIPMRTGIEVGEWWEPKDMTQALVAWRGRNPAKDNVGFYLFEWANPHPDKKIDSIVFRSTNNTAVPILIGITASPKKIDIGPYPRPYRDQGATVCEYRERIKTAPDFEKGPKQLTVTRVLPIAKESQVKHARIDVVRYRSDRPAKVQCTLAGVTKTTNLPAGQLRAQFIFSEKDVLKYLTEHKQGFSIIVNTDDPEGFAAYRYETNPNHDWILTGEDFKHGVYGVSAVYMITPFLPDHKYSGYVENRPKGITALPTVKETVELKPGDPQTDWLGSKICLSTTWQWQPGAKKGFVATEDKIPSKGWKDILIPADVGPNIFEKDPYCISAWFKKDLFIPPAWQGKRIVIQFDSVSDFATVFCNGKKLVYHEGVAAFEADLTPAIKFGQTNTIHVFSENVFKGMILATDTLRLKDVEALVMPYKGHAYRIELVRGAWDQKPDEVELLLDGKDVGKKAGDPESVIKTGDGLYHRQLEWNTSFLFFSVPGNVDLKSLRDRLAIRYYSPGVFTHQGRPDAPHHWRSPRSCATGLTRDVFLSVTGKSFIDDVFIRTSMQRMQLEADVECKNVPAEGATLSATVRDGTKTVLDLGVLPVNASGSKITLTREWKNPQIWCPKNPYLYYLQIELKDNAGRLLDRRFERFGFREFRIEGPEFVFNGKKPFYIQNASFGMWFGQLNRVHLRWLYLDMNQQANINMVRGHQFGTQYPDTAEVADEMGMLLQPEDPYFIPRWAYDDQGLIDFEKLKIPIQWTVAAMKRMRNHPSVVMWSADNEHQVDTRPEQLTPSGKSMAEAILRLNTAIKTIDPIRPIVNNGDSVFAMHNYWKDPRLDTIDGHYVNFSFFANWKQRFGKPCTTGEEALGGPFAWTYQHPTKNMVLKGEDARTYFWNNVNAAANYIGSRIQSWKKLELAGICPFSFQLQYNPFLLAWPGVQFGDPGPDVPWPAQAGEGPKPKNYGYDYQHSYNFFDPNAPRIYLRTFNAVKDSFDQVPKLRPRLSPEVVIELVDPAGKPLRDTVVWLIPTDQPGAPFGIPTDPAGKAWFWCKPGPGKYRLQTQIAGESYHAEITPAPPGEWLQVKTIRCQNSGGTASRTR